MAFELKQSHQRNPCNSRQNKGASIPEIQHPIIPNVPNRKLFASSNSRTTVRRGSPFTSSTRTSSGRLGGARAQSFCAVLRMAQRGVLATSSVWVSTFCVSRLATATPASIEGGFGRMLRRWGYRARGWRIVCQQCMLPCLGLGHGSIICTFGGTSLDVRVSASLQRVGYVIVHGEDSQQTKAREQTTEVGARSNWAPTRLVYGTLEDEGFAWFQGPKACRPAPTE